MVAIWNDESISDSIRLAQELRAAVCELICIPRLISSVNSLNMHHRLVFGLWR